MTSSPDQSAIAALIATGRVKFISALVVIALVLGIVSEVISVVTSYHEMNIKAYEDAVAQGKSRGHF